MPRSGRIAIDQKIKQLSASKPSETVEKGLLAKGLKA